MDFFKKKYTYNLGYALSGGGAKGFAHLGALKVLDLYHLKPEIIAGTSAGALAGVFYADGFEPEEIAELFRGSDFRQFVEFSLPNTGFFKSKRLHSFLKKNLRSHNFESLQIPFVTVTTDWQRGRTVLFSEGDNLVDSVIASCSVPIVFQPQYIDNVPYVDGGVLKNFPVSVIRKSCKTIIGINVTELAPSPTKMNLINMAERTFHLMSLANTIFDRKLCDILIEAKGTNKYSMFNLTNIEKIAEIGIDSTIEKLKEPKSIEIVTACRKNQHKNIFDFL